MKLTRTLSIIISRDLWLWLSENPDKIKLEYPLFDEFDIEEFESHCALCEYYNDEDDKKDQNNDCPLNIDNYCYTDCAGGDFDTWLNCNNEEEPGYMYEEDDLCIRKHAAISMYLELDKALNNIKEDK